MSYQSQRLAETKPATCVWVGASNTEYTFHIFPLPVTFDPNQDGNYIYARLSERGKWVPIYIGEGDLADRATNHHKAACIRAKGATHFHCHLNPNHAARRTEEADLLARYTNAYYPTGCNERRGG